MALTYAPPAITYWYIPFVLAVSTFALWGLLRMLSFVFGGWRHHDRVNAAAPAAGAGAAPGYGPGAGVAAGPVAAGAGTTGFGGRMYKPTRYVSDGLETLLWLVFFPTVINAFFGFANHTARNLIIAIFSIGLMWAFSRFLGHIPVLGFLHRILDLALLVLVPMSIAAAVLPIRDNHSDFYDD